MPERKAATVWTEEEEEKLKKTKLYRNGERQSNRFGTCGERQSKQYYSESSKQLQIVHMVLYIPPTQAKAESVFSFQKWLIGNRAVSLTPANCDARVRGRSCKKLKRKLNEAKKEMKKAKKMKLQ